MSTYDTHEVLNLLSGKTYLMDGDGYSLDEPGEEDFETVLFSKGPYEVKRAREIGYIVINQLEDRRVACVDTEQQARDFIIYAEYC